MCKPKNQGGLGIKNVKWFNWVLLGKWFWRGLTCPDSLWVRVLEAKHGKLDSVFFSDSVISRCSIWWKDLIYVVH